MSSLPAPIPHLSDESMWLFRTLREGCAKGPQELMETLRGLPVQSFSEEDGRIYRWFLDRVNEILQAELLRRGKRAEADALARALEQPLFPNDPFRWPEA